MIAAASDSVFALMPAPRNQKASPSPSAATVGYEAQLWQMADAPRGSMDAAEYKHVCLGLLFLKYTDNGYLLHE
jgi:type I restriction enzyme M protein